MIKTLFRFAGACLCGLILSLWILQNNHRIQQLISEKIISSLQESWKVRVDTKNLQFNFFTSSAYCVGGFFTPTDDKKFSWHFDECKIKVSPFDLIFKKRLCLEITFNQISAKTQVSEQQIDIIQHIFTMFEIDDDDLKIRVSSIKINNLDVECAWNKSIIKSSMQGTFYLAKKKDEHRPDRSWEGYVNLISATTKIDDCIFVDQASGSGQIFKNKQNDSWDVQADLSFLSSLFDPVNSYKAHIAWAPDKWAVELTNADATKLNMNYAQNQVSITGVIPLTPVVHSLNSIQAKPCRALHVQGLCSVDLQGSFHDGYGDVKGTCQVSDGLVGPISWKRIDIACKTPKPFVFAGSAEVHLSPSLMLKTLFAYNYKDNQGLVKLSNKTPISLIRGPLRAEWLIKPDQLKASLQLNKEVAKAHYSCHVVDTSSDERVSLQGTCFMRDDQIWASGTLLNQADASGRPSMFGLKAVRDPSFLIQRFIYQNKNERLIDLHALKTDPTKLEGSIKYALIHSYFDPTFQRAMFGSNCAFDLKLNQNSYEHLDGSLKLASGRFYIPDSRNLITRIATDFSLDLPRRKIALTETSIGFCKGVLRCPRATISFDEHGEVSTIHAPLSMDHLFINWKRDFYGFIYGNFLLSKMPNSGMNLSGNVVLERSLLKDNILSQDDLGNVSGPVGLFNLGSHQLEVDIAVTTEKPMRVVTDSLESSAHLDMRVQYEHNNDVLQIPRITGAITLDGGYLKFLRNQLHIEHGRIQFLTNQMNDPLIDLTAKNKINKYQIMLQVTGSVQKPTIILESSPELTEEQVFGLLIAGSEDTTLQAALPAMLMQHLHKILLGSKRRIPHGASLIQKLTKPLQYVQITPNFTDQSGRGGIKGTVSVDLNDQFHAQIQKNFNLQDDFSFYLQYMLSDDISLRAVKDQRGEIGSEVEVRLRL
ncbi:translocation/assembly module TamB domain-containing protein [Candidatus Dependentiae bacterium]|nr:translocation/assembly module TamB domain-containing protein [Candidatus Dependentiae bacterium]